MNNIVYEHGINDMPRGWTKANKWNYKVYVKWRDMLRRVYSENFHKKQSTYINTTLQLEMHWLSYFVEHFKEIDGYDDEKFLKGELELDKDIKSNGQNKEYSIENCMLVNRYNNRSVVWKNKNFSNEHRENISKSKIGTIPYNKGMNMTDEQKEKLRKSSKERFKNKENHPCCKKIVQYDLNGNLIKVWEYINKASNELNICQSSISLCLTNKRKTAGGFIWKYYDGDDNNE